MHRAASGVTIIEFIAASSIAMVLSGVALVLMTTSRDVFNTSSHLSRSSNRLDVSATFLRRDIWAAQAACNGIDTLCPAPALPNLFLVLLQDNTETVPGTLDNLTAGDVAYSFEALPEDSASRGLTRRIWNGGSWGSPDFIARHMAITTSNLSGDPLIAITLQASRNVDDRQYMRSMSTRYRRQSP